MFGVMLFLAENSKEGAVAILLAVVLFAGGAVSIDTAERRQEKVPVLTDSHGNTYYTHTHTITNKFHDTYYSVPSGQTHS